MRILSYNIHGCIGRDGREAPDRILEVIQSVDADIVGLQEVHREDALDRDFLRKLEGLPYRAVIYGKTMRKPTADYGNVLLLRQPPHSIQRIELPRTHGEARGAIIADTLQHGHSYRVITTHLDLRLSDRRKQMATLLQNLSPPGESENCILLGDFNEWFPIRPYFRNFKAQFNTIASLKTFPVSPAFFALDRIALCGQVRNCHYRTVVSKQASIASDHRPLVCEFTWR
jgi:endonuclease/exonuclease/phosphatase family metal-dependent hydrolase